MNIHETLVKLRVMLHEAEVDASMDDIAMAAASVNQMAKIATEFCETGEGLCSTCLCEKQNDTEPCNSCDDPDSKWESKQEDDPEAKECNTCKYEGFVSAEEPCNTCLISPDGRYHQWVSKQEDDPEATKVQSMGTATGKRCDNCKNRLKDEFCVDKSNWEPKQ